MAAGPGYGKTTVLSQWAEADGRSFVWLSLDERDDDPAILAADLVCALGVVRPGSDLDELAKALERPRCPAVLVLDDVHVVQAPASVEVVRTIAEHLPPGCQLVIATRIEPTLPLADWSVHRELLRVGPDDLAMMRGEGDALLRAADVELGAADLDALLHLTEGWPAGLALAAAALAEQADRHHAVASFSGDDRLVAGYLREQLLRRLPPDLAGFLTSASVLERLSAEACDAVLQRSDSGRVLAELEQRHAFLVPLDRREHSYRQHRLVREMLASELRRQTPARDLDLHVRASAWHEARGQPQEAIGHAVAAGDAGRVSRLVWVSLPRVHGSGSLASLQSWLDALPEERIVAHPPLATALAWCCLEAGDAVSAERYRVAAGKGWWGSTSGEAARAALRAVLGEHGVTRMGDDASLGRAVAPPGGPWRDVCCLLEGIAARLQGEGERARSRLQEAARLAAGRHAPEVLAPSLAQLALLAVADGDAGSAHALARQARGIVATEGVSGHTGLIQVHAAAALALASRGQVAESRSEIDDAKRLLSAPGCAPAWLETDARIALANASLLTGDASEARALIRDAGYVLARTPDSGMLTQELDASRRRADDFRRVGVLGPSALTQAELRILRLLPTHLSYHEIGQQLQRSQYTVKSQALAAFRKLDVSSRSEAVQRARSLGLIPG